MSWRRPGDQLLPSEDSLILLVFYRWVDGVTDLDYPIEMVRLWSIPEEDLEIVRDDWETIVEKVRDGRAHRLSEGDTRYLAATVKGQKASDRRVQPYSDEPAKPRAFSFKASYMQSVVDASLLHEAQPVATVAELRGGKTLEDIVAEHFRPFLGQSARKIAASLGVSVQPKAKNYHSVITKRILGVAEDKKILEFEKAG